MTEIQIKRAVKAGNSSAVILPRSWLDKDVRIELAKKSHETMLIEVIKILNTRFASEKIIGIYLVGSYARKEETEDSDIDVLVITDDIDMKMIKEGIYNITVISLELLKQKLEQDLLPVGQMVREANPLINSKLISSLEIKVTKKNIKWYLDTTEDKLTIIKGVLDIAKRKNKANLGDAVVYTLVLRARTLHIIKKLIKNEAYSKREFVGLIRSVSGGNSAYDSYVNYKNNLDERNETTIEEAEGLYKYLKDELEKVKKLVASFKK